MLQVDRTQILLDKALIRDGLAIPGFASFPFSFEITNAEKCTHFVLNAESYLDKLIWMNDLENCIEAAKMIPEVKIQFSCTDGS